MNLNIKLSKHNILHYYIFLVSMVINSSNAGALRSSFKKMFFGDVSQSFMQSRRVRELLLVFVRWSLHRMHNHGHNYIVLCKKYRE